VRLHFRLAQSGGGLSQRAEGGTDLRFFGSRHVSRMIYHQDRLFARPNRSKRKRACFRVNYRYRGSNRESLPGHLLFLGVPYDTRMLKLDKADLSTIYKARIMRISARNY